MGDLLHIAVIGLTYDVVGVLILGHAFFGKSLEAILIESGTYWGGNDALMKSLIETKVDGIAGTTMLLVGFFLQLISYLHVDNKLASSILWGALLILVAGYFLGGRRRIVTAQLSRAAALRKKAEA